MDAVRRLARKAAALNGPSAQFGSKPATPAPSLPRTPAPTGQVPAPPTAPPRPATPPPPSPPPVTTTPGRAAVLGQMAAGPLSGIVGPALQATGGVGLAALANMPRGFGEMRSLMRGPLSGR